MQRFSARLDVEKRGDILQSVDNLSTDVRGVMVLIKNRRLVLSPRFVNGCVNRT